MALLLLDFINFLIGNFSIMQTKSKNQYQLDIFGFIFLVWCINEEKLNAVHNLNFNKEK